MSNNKRYHLLMISHRFSSDLSVFTTREELDGYLYEYVKENWNEWLSKTPIPQTQEDAIKTYFSVAGADMNPEYYITDECIMDPKR